MTYKEKLAKEYPDGLYMSGESGCSGCPKSYGYEETYPCDNCNITCADCWNREIPNTEPTTNEREEKETMPTTTKRTKAELLDEIKNLREEVDKLDRYKKYEDGANECFNVMQAFINAGFTREEAFTIIMSQLEKYKEATEG